MIIIINNNNNNNGDGLVEWEEKTGKISMQKKWVQFSFDLKEESEDDCISELMKNHSGDDSVATGIAVGVISTQDSPPAL